MNSTLSETVGSALLADANGIPPDIARLTAGPFIGIICNWTLFGVLVVQLYVYSLNFPNDRRALRVLVYGLFILEVAQTVLTTMDGFHWFVYGWGNMNALGQVYMAAIDSPILDGVIGFIVQSYFCWRIAQLGGRVWKRFACFLFLIAFTQMTAGFVTAVRALISNSIAGIREKQTVETALWLACSAAVDTGIAISMTLLLMQSRTNEPYTNDVIGKIIKMVIETNSLTAGIAVLTLILFVAFPNENFFFCPPYILGKLYTNTVLVILNNRIQLSAPYRKSLHHSPRAQVSSQVRWVGGQAVPVDSFDEVCNRRGPTILVEVRQETRKDLEAREHSLA